MSQEWRKFWPRAPGGLRRYVGNAFIFAGAFLALAGGADPVIPLGRWNGAYLDFDKEAAQPDIDPKPDQAHTDTSISRHVYSARGE